VRQVPAGTDTHLEHFTGNAGQELRLKVSLRLYIIKAGIFRKMPACCMKLVEGGN